MPQSVRVETPPEASYDKDAEKQNLAAPSIEAQDVRPLQENVEARKELRDNPSGASLAPVTPVFSTARQIALVVSLTGAAFLNTLAVQAVVIVLPTIGRDLRIPDSRQQWIVSAYSLTFGCFLLLFGRLADIYGKRRIYLAGSAWLTVITIATPFLRNEIAFDLFRGLQGMGAAANVPTAIGILGITFPPGKRKNYAFAVYGGGAPLGSIFGNLLGGVLAQYASWQWIFWVLSIIAAVITIASYFIIPLPPANIQVIGSKKTVDWIGGTFITVGLLVLMFALTEGNVVGWSTPWIPVLIVVGLLMVAAFIVWSWYLEHKTSRNPLMKVSIFTSVQFSAAIAIMFFFFATFNNYLIFATYFYQSYLGLDAIQTTLRFIPTGVVGVMTIFVTAQILSRVPGNYILIWGNMCVAVSCLLMAMPIDPNETYWAYGFPAMCLSVFGADTLFPTLTLFVSRSLPPEDQAMGGGLVNAVGQIGRSIGLAIATAIQVAVIAGEKHVPIDRVGNGGSAMRDQQYLDGVRAAQWYTFATGIVAVVIVIFAFRGAGIIGNR